MNKALLVLAEASLELVPKAIASHTTVKRSAARRGKKPTEILLDKSLHYHAMKSLPDNEKRGRPDIVHTCLLLALSSPLNIKGMLDTVIHTINKDVIYVRSDTRIPRNYNRFVGLMEQLFLEGKVPPKSEAPLLWLERKVPLRNVLENWSATKIFLLDETGEQIRARELAKKIVREEKPAIVIGAFPHGKFSEETLNCADEIVSIYPKTLDTWSVVAILLTLIGDEIGIL